LNENKFLDEPIPTARFKEINSLMTYKNIDNKNYKRIGDENVLSSLNFKDAFTNLQNVLFFIKIILSL